MGGGGSKSSNRSNIVSTAASNVIVKNIMDCKSNTWLKQKFTLIGSGNVVSGFKQVMNFKLSSDCSQSAQSLTSLQTDIANAVKQSAESNNVALLGAFGSSQSEVELNIRNAIENNVTQETISNIVNQTNAAQEALIIGDNNIVDNFTQDMTMSLLQDNAQKALSSVSIINKMDNEADQKSKSTMENPISQILDSVGKMLSSLIAGYSVTTIMLALVAIVGIIYLGPKILEGGPAALLFKSSSSTDKKETTGEKKTGIFGGYF